MKDRVVLPKETEVFGQSLGGLQAGASEVSQGSGNDVFKISSKGIHLGAANFDDAPFSVDMQGNVVAETLVTTELHIPNSTTANSFHVDTAGNTWWGATTFAAAVASVSKAGAGIFTSVTLSGSVAISGIANNTSTDISLLEKTHDLVFSVTDADTIAWATGTIVLSNGRTFTIDAGNTGNMSALTYIYLDPAVSSTVLQTTTTYSAAMGANKSLLGMAQNNTVTAMFIPYGAGTPLIDGANIGALSIVAGNIAASTITAGKLSVSQLSAITADMGSITAGDMVLASNGFIRSGQTAYDTGTGWFIGNPSGTPKLSIGVGSGFPSLTWDGADLNIKGTLQIINQFVTEDPLVDTSAVYLANSSTGLLTHLNTGADSGSGVNFGDQAANTKIAQSILPGQSRGINRVTVNLGKVGSPVDNVKLSVQTDSGGSPSGTELASTTLDGSTLTGAGADKDFNLTVFASSASLIWVVLERSGANDAVNYYFADTSTDAYTGGTQKVYNGSTWGAGGAGDLRVLIKLNTTAGRVYLTNAEAAAQVDRFIGFATTTYAPSDTANIQVEGTKAGFVGLSTGVDYFLQDEGSVWGANAGTIGTTAGSNSKKVGWAAATTKIQLKYT